VDQSSGIEPLPAGPLRSIFDFESYDGVKEFLDDAGIRDDINDRIAVWGRLFRRPVNHLFGM